MEFKIFASVGGAHIIGEVDELGFLHTPFLLLIRVGQNGLVLDTLPLNPLAPPKNIKDSTEPINIKDAGLIELRNISMNDFNNLKDEYYKQLTGIEIVPANQKLN